ncbi:MAG: hypothetical protein ABID38_02260 [Candidatus Diapherotrites archaeon]
MAIEELIFTDIFTQAAFFIVSFALLGAGIKYVDDAFDERTFSRKNALVIAVITAILWAWVMSIHPAAATILGAVVIAVLLKGKVDNIAFQIGVLAILGIMFVSGYFEFFLFPMAIIAIAGIADELGNDYVDKHPKINIWIYYFFEYRFVMKLAVALFAFLETYSWIFFFAFVAFDIAYAGVTHYSLYLKNLRKFHFNGKGNNVNGNGKSPVNNNGFHQVLK